MIPVECEYRRFLSMIELDTELLRAVVDLSLSRGPGEAFVESDALGQTTA